MSKNYKALVIDNSPQYLEFIKEILLYNGYDVIKTTSGKKGIVYAVKYKPDLIILEAMMPHIDGYTILSKIMQI